MNRLIKILEDHYLSTTSSSGDITYFLRDSCVVAVRHKNLYTIYLENTDNGKLFSLNLAKNFRIFHKGTTYRSEVFEIFEHTGNLTGVSVFKNIYMELSKSPNISFAKKTPLNTFKGDVAGIIYSEDDKYFISMLDVIWYTIVPILPKETLNRNIYLISSDEPQKNKVSDLSLYNYLRSKGFSGPELKNTKISNCSSFFKTEILIAKEPP